MSMSPRSSPYLHLLVWIHADRQRPAPGHPVERLVRYPDAVDQSSNRKPAGKRPVPAGEILCQARTKKQRRNQAVRSVSLERRPPWQSPTVVTISSVAVVAIVLIVIVLINSAGGSNPTVTKPVPAGDPDRGRESERVGGQHRRLRGARPARWSASRLREARGFDGKPLVVYVGAEYCPYCAAERWVMVMWLSRFGTFKNLSEIQSSSTDVCPNTDTFTFYKSSYSSPYIDFSPNEVEDRNQAPLRR